MNFERETRMIDKDGNFLFEHSRRDVYTDPWMESLKQDEEEAFQRQVERSNLDQPV